jgi:hypothetical protein
MPRTTLEIDGTVLRDVRRIQKKQGKSLGRTVSDLLSHAIAAEKSGSAAPAFRWISRPMRARVDLLDKEAVRIATGESARKVVPRRGRKS